MLFYLAFSRKLTYPLTMKIIKKWLGLEELETRVNTLESLLLNEKAKNYGFAVLKKHLQRPDKALPYIGGKEIEQD
jgi:hypothetical protein